MDIYLRNSMTRKVERFQPIDPDHVRIYLCGPTVYDRAHLGNARNVVMFDVLYRVLRAAYPRVSYARNYTDVDDRIVEAHLATGQPVREITDRTIGWYEDDMERALGTLAPDHKPRAMDYVPQMIAMIQCLIEKGHAYEAAGEVLFRVRSDPGYGRLTGRTLEGMRAGERVEVAPHKEDPMDFVLWKPETVAGATFESPWGPGRPGWHIECSAMAADLLGEEFDIHGGGLDLQFPHHENEIAQSLCAHGNECMARYWIHNEMLLVEGRKMSKSLGNFFTVRDLLDEGVPGEVIRFVLLSSHYGKTMDWTAGRAAEAEATLRKWRAATAGVAPAPVAEAVVEAAADDLNTPKAIAELHVLTDPAVLLGSARFLGLLT